ncbi:UNVERIFIED_CONTAM: putative disease resistance protein [Sesamum latifolium]|uniref:Disease resistance protein n=1 Tax=Sesamum latifolium TaxID=2727402 RepID=A0AAW2XW23_9LAMI
MTTVSAVRTAAERLDYLLLADEGAPARCAGDLRAGIVQLRSDLSAIEKFLIEADRSNNIINGDFRKRVAHLAYEIEDAVESYARQEAARKSSGGLIISYLLEYCFTGRSLHKDLYIFRSRIDQLKHFMDAVNPVARAGTRERSSSSNSGEQEQVIDANIDHSQPVLIGMEENKETLRSYLLGGGKPELSVIAIRGMGGIGKTSLVKLLYNDPLLVKHFDNRAWAAIGQDFQARDILETMLLSLASGLLSKNEIAEMETMELMEQLYQAQKGRRYLIVLDDLWSEEAWDNLRFAFPDDCNGSRILITTWSIRVAAIATDVLEVRPLGTTESWRLFEIKSGLNDPDIEYIAADKMEVIGKEIVGHCAGVPLAIAVIGGILRAKNLEYWDLILHKLQQDFQNLHEDFQRTVKSVLHTIILSYKELPSHLKPCFIYLGHFPPDQAISVEILYLLWMAEGLISVRDASDKARIEVAEDYFNELVNRSLVISVEEQDQASSSRRFKSCQVHDLIRDLCEWKGTREEFFQVIDFGPGSKNSSPTHRVAVYLNKFEDRNDFSVNVPEAKHIRAILFFDTDKSLPRSTWPREFSDLKVFQWTRILNFDGVDFRVRKLPRGIEKLVYLRYLSFRGCYLLEFPSALSNFPFLETLDLRVRVSCVMTIPNVLRKLSRLRHLYFPSAFRSDTKDKLKLDSLKKLEFLENFNASICDANDLLQLENLQILTGMVDGHNVDLKNTISSLNRVKLLGRSSIVVKNFDSYSVERLSIVAALLECNALNALDIEGYIGELPLHRKIGSNFTELVFNGSEFRQDPMPVLGKLPNLRSLVLCNDAFVGKKMVCSELNFPQLRCLKLVTLHLIEELEMQMGALARLTILTIEQCDRLRTIPYKLAGIPTLTSLMIGSMPEGFQNGVNKLIEEMRESANDELTVTFYDC